MVNHLHSVASFKVNVPNGFAVTSHAYRYFLEKAGIEDKIKGTPTQPPLVMSATQGLTACVV
jgi:phosphoenolpyruvate synthase/pyruvate phosphate dikinase